MKESPPLRPIYRKRFISNIGFIFLAIPLFAFLLFIAYMIFYLFSNGINVLSWEFLTKPPKQGMTAGGILPCIVGTVYITLISLILSIPIGVLAAIYLAEYAPNNIFTRLIRSAIRSLAGIPSIVYGLFGVALLIRGIGIPPSVLASGVTLGLMNLPWIIATAEEAIHAIPGSFREGALAIGATKWEAIRYNVLPFAFPGILTGVLLALARTMGETAPILFTGVSYYTSGLPQTVLHKFMALPYHLFTLATQHDQIMKVRPLAFGTAVALLILVLTFDAIAFIIRLRIATTNKWQV